MFQIFMTIVVFYAIYFHDIALLSFTKKDDYIFQNLNIFAFSIFLFELVINTIALPDYFLSFFFWLDLCSTFSLLLEIKIAMNSWPKSNKNTQYSKKNIIYLLMKVKISTISWLMLKIIKKNGILNWWLLKMTWKSLNMRFRRWLRVYPRKKRRFLIWEMI